MSVNRAIEKETESGGGGVVIQNADTRTLLLFDMRARRAKCRDLLSLAYSAEIFGNKTVSPHVNPLFPFS